MTIRPENRVPAALAGIIVVLAAALVAMSFDRPAVEVHLPTPPEPAEAGDGLVGPVTYTVDASSTGDWRFFDFSRGSVVHDPGPLDWDLAFRRFHIIANGGPGFSGFGGVVRLEETDFDAVSELPDTVYVETTARRDSANAAIARWYSYGWTSHLLTPHPAVYGIRTADGRYAKLQLLGYYCPGAQPGCLAFRYVYQGAGGRSVVAPASHTRVTDPGPGSAGLDRSDASRAGGQR